MIIHLPPAFQSCTRALTITTHEVQRGALSLVLSIPTYPSLSPTSRSTKGTQRPAGSQGGLWRTDTSRCENSRGTPTQYARLRGRTNLLPFCLRHPKLVMAQKEGPDSLPDLVLDPAVIDQPQQLLVLVTLREELRVSAQTQPGPRPIARPCCLAVPRHRPPQTRCPFVADDLRPLLGRKQSQRPPRAGVLGNTGSPQPKSLRVTAVPPSAGSTSGPGHR